MSYQQGYLVKCLECGTLLGGEGNPDPYKHMLHCLNVEPDALDRIKATCLEHPNEHSRRILHIIEAVQRPAYASRLED